MIELRDVHKAFGSQQVLAGVSFTVPDGGALVIMGPSGSGKSVLLKHIIGLLRPDRGEVRVDGRSVPELGPRELRELRREMGYLFQSGALINWLTVFENVALPLRETTDLDSEAIAERVREVLALVHMEDAAHKMPGEISGGMQKRVGLARALVTRPRYILYDEPEAGLDPEMSANISHGIREVNQRLGITSVTITHSIPCAREVGDRLAIFDQGRILVEGEVEEVLASDIPRVRRFLGLETD